ncbi:hypothetical protein K474DRAFT_1437922 [Panus rudis PR-1116 ss-1]|nr:hypothetical protein K474DRAFT_1437922 [Panus rudis PR-1116 ss-1]
MPKVSIHSLKILLASDLAVCYMIICDRSNLENSVTRDKEIASRESWGELKGIAFLGQCRPYREANSECRDWSRAQPFSRTPPPQRTSGAFWQRTQDPGKYPMNFEVRGGVCIRTVQRPFVSGLDQGLVGTGPGFYPDRNQSPKNQEKSLFFRFACKFLVRIL